MTQIAPKCPIHLGREMRRVGEITKDGHQGQKDVLGFRYRCSVDLCPACETVLIPPLEVELTKFGRRKRQRRRSGRVTSRVKTF
jgi:hypothetical protein